MKTFNYYLIKIDRFSAWVLFVSMFLYFITGYGMTKGIISPSFSKALHIDYLSYFVITAFVIHTSIAIRLAFIRWQAWNILSKSTLLITYLAFVGFFIYAEFFYEIKPKTINSNSSNSSNTSVTNSSTPSSQPTTASTSTATPTPTQSQTSTSNNIQTSTPTPTSTIKTFTLAELAKYDGLNGNPPYVAVDGKVYDMTDVFSQGSHYSHFAGQELTSEFYSAHAKSAITKYPVVGTLQK